MPGICCSYGEGYFKIRKDGAEIASGDGQFGSSEVLTFGACPNGPPPPPTTSSPSTQPTPSPTNEATPSPTNEPTSPPSSISGQVVAAYDSSMRAPACTTVGTSCTSGGLLDGTAGNQEPNGGLNAIDGCADGSSGTYHVDESVDAITVSSLGGGMLEAGGLVRIEAKVWAYGQGTYDAADFYWATDAADLASPGWNHIGTVPADGPELRTLAVEHQLSMETVQAVRVVFRYGGSPGSCTGGNYDDHDDLVFAVQEGSGDGAPPAKMPKPVPAAKPLDPSACASVADEDRCDALSVCRWDIVSCVAKN